MVERQVVYEGKHVNVLYNYAPISHLHFLIVPKKHCEKMPEMSGDAFVESKALTFKLINHYYDQGHSIAYAFSKVEVRAGQTVPHYHEHLIFTATKVEGFLGKLRVFKNMLFGSSPLANDEVRRRVTNLRQELADL